MARKDKARGGASPARAPAPAPPAAAAEPPPPRLPPSPLAMSYLAFYNFVLSVGWAGCLYVMVRALLRGKGIASVWAVGFLPVRFFQTAAGLEVLHAAMGLVPSGVGPALMQACSKRAFLWREMVTLSEGHVH